MWKYISVFLAGALLMTAIGEAREHAYADIPIRYALTGWVEEAESRTWTYSSADDPSFVASVNDDITAYITPGYRVRLKQGGDYKYFGVNKVELSGGNTLITLYGGTDYDLANSAITNVAISPVKSPVGFPMNPDKWTVEVINSTDVEQASPVSGTWYNVEDISIPIGAWNVEYHLVIATGTSGTQYTQNFYSTLSTGSTTESNTHFTSFSGITTASQLFSFSNPLYKSDVISISSKTPYYLNIKTTTTVDSIGTYGTTFPTIIRAVWAYL